MSNPSEKGEETSDLIQNEVETLDPAMAVEVKKLLTAVAKGLKQMLKDVAEDVKQQSTEVAEDVKQLSTEVAEEVKEVSSAVAEEAKQIFMIVTEDAKKMSMVVAEDAKQLLTDVAKEVKQLSTATAEVLKQLSTAIAEALKELVIAIAKEVKKLIMAVAGEVKKLITFVAKELEQLSTAVAGEVKKLSTAVAKEVEQLSMTVTQEVEQLFTAVAKEVGRISTTVEKETKQLSTADYEAKIFSEVLYSFIWNVFNIAPHQRSTNERGSRFTGSIGIAVLYIQMDVRVICRDFILDNVSVDILTFYTVIRRHLRHLKSEINIFYRFLISCAIIAEYVMAKHSLGSPEYLTLAAEYFTKYFEEYLRDAFYENGGWNKLAEYVRHFVLITTDLTRFIRNLSPPFQPLSLNPFHPVSLEYLQYLLPQDLQHPSRSVSSHPQSSQVSELSLHAEFAGEQLEKLVVQKTKGPRQRKTAQRARASERKVNPQPTTRVPRVPRLTADSKAEIFAQDLYSFIWYASRVTPKKPVKSEGSKFTETIGIAVKHEQMNLRISNRNFILFGAFEPDYIYRHLEAHLKSFSDQEDIFLTVLVTSAVIGEYILSEYYLGRNTILKFANVFWIRYFEFNLIDEFYEAGGWDELAAYASRHVAKSLGDTEENSETDLAAELTETPAEIKLADIEHGPSIPEAAKSADVHPQSESSYLNQGAIPKQKTLSKSENTRQSLSKPSGFIIEKKGGKRDTKRENKTEKRVAQETEKCTEVGAFSEESSSILRSEPSQKELLEQHEELKGAETKSKRKKGKKKKSSRK